MSRDEHESETERGRAVYRWLYGGFAAIALVLGGTYLWDLDIGERLFGVAPPNEGQAAERRAEEASRATFQKATAKLSAGEETTAQLAIPTDRDGFFAPPLESELPDGPDGEAIRRGREIFLNPGANATEFVGNSLACANCHLDAGRRPNSAPMWAAAGQYPKYRGKNKQINTMEDRINGCFTYSMNAPAGPAGGPPPPGHQVYKDLEAYFHWLATGAPNRTELPGGGYPEPEEPANGYDITRGAEVFEARCAVCHGEDGQGRHDLNGRYVFPPLWGPDSFNWGAGMHRVNTAAGFIYANMPLGLPYSLTPQEAWDVAAFMNSHERPPDPRQVGKMTVQEADEKYHDHPDFYGDLIDGKLVGTGVQRDPSAAPSGTGTVVPGQ